MKWKRNYTQRLNQGATLPRKQKGTHSEEHR